MLWFFNFRKTSVASTKRCVTNWLESRLRMRWDEFRCFFRSTTSYTLIGKLTGHIKEWGWGYQRVWMPWCRWLKEVPYSSRVTKILVSWIRIFDIGMGWDKLSCSIGRFLHPILSPGVQLKIRRSFALYPETIINK
jgi:hypothetical protein